MPIGADSDIIFQLERSIEWAGVEEIYNGRIS